MIIYRRLRVLISTICLIQRYSTRNPLTDSDRWRKIEASTLIITGKASHFCICLRDDIVSTTEYRYCSNRYSQKVASRCQIFLKNAGTKFRTSRILYSACHERRSLVMHRRILLVQPYGIGSKSSENW